MVFVAVVVASLACAALLEMHARSSAPAPSRGGAKDFVVRALLVAVTVWGVLYWTGSPAPLDDAVYNMQLGEPDF